MKILVAAPKPTVRLIESILGDIAAIESAGRIAEAQEILRTSRIDLVLCSLQFDESRMFDLLVAANSNQRTRCIPFICFHHLASVLRPAALRTLDVSCRANGSRFVDLADLIRRCGPREAAHCFREMILAYSPNRQTRATA
jgi:response regulator RpfG family c-di-GMP phosphodiesterase